MSTIEARSEVTGSVWKILVNVGDRVTEDQPLMILESMKMEIPILATEDGVVREITVAEGNPIANGDVAAIIEV
jgi:acetyl-CoA carboxylase biotin carboxyl carrier protein